MSASLSVFNYLANNKTQGKLASEKEKEESLNYQEKAQQAKKEEELLQKKVDDELRRQYTGKNTISYQQISFKTMYLHYKFGNGSPLYVDISGERIPSLSAERDFNNEIGKIKLLNSFSLNKLSTIGMTIGSARFKYLGQQKVEILPDRYDFDIRKGSSFTRNVATLIGGIIHNMPISPIHWNTAGGTPYDVYLKGQATINP